MFFLSIVCLLFLGVSYKSNNPLISAMGLILALVSVSPLLSLVSCAWYIFLLLILFLSGIIVVMIYFASVSSYTFKVVVGGSLLLLGLVFYPYLVITIYSISTVSVLYSVWIISVLIVLVLGVLILFSSYILSSQVPLRSL